MLHSLLTPNVVSYSATVSACEKNQQQKAAFHLLWDMLRNFPTPGVVSYSETVSACQKNQRKLQCDRQCVREE